MKNVAFCTLGCKVNQYETQAINGIFRNEGYEVVDFEDKADVYVINTCTVTSLSDRKSRQMIRKAKKNNPESIVVVVGCYAQTAPEEVAGIPGVNLIIGTKERAMIPEYIRRIENGEEQINAVNDIMGNRYFEELSVDSNIERTRAYLKIQEGCSQFCSYCIIPYARGPIRSRKKDEVLEEARKMAAAGFKEIVLTGIHVASYGKDTRESSLMDIIQEIHEIFGIERIRLGSLEPTIITDEFARIAQGLPKLCPHYHISLQSGCDATLKRMNRKYSSKEYEEVVMRLRAHIPDVAITTDVMVGFPGETDEEFNKTYDFLNKINLYQMHVFKFSPRKGTPAADFEDQVPPEIKEIRSKQLINLSRENTLAFNRKYEGLIVPVIIDQHFKDSEDLLEGMTSNYINVAVKADEALIGQIVNVRIAKAQEDYVEGELV